MLAGKSVQVFHEIKPATRALGLLLNAPDPFYVPLQREVEAAAKAQQVEVVPLMLKGREELEAAYAELARRGVDGVLVQPSLSLQAAAEFALKSRLPAVSFFREFAAAGGLLSLGPDQSRHRPDLGRLRRPGIEGRAHGRPADPAGDQVRAGR